MSYKFLLVVKYLNLNTKENFLNMNLSHKLRNMLSNLEEL